MAELRRDPIAGRWTVIDSDHLKGPKDFPKNNNRPGRQAICPFCPGREWLTPHETGSVRPSVSKPDSPGWQVRTVPNKFPVLAQDEQIDHEKVGVYDMMSGVGAHEVVIEHPDHTKTMTDLTVPELQLVLKQYQSRYINLSRDQRLKYILIFKNFGSSAGATVEHTHSQVIALPMVPKTVQEEIKGSEEYHQQHGTCVYCDMISQELKDKERIVVQNDVFLAFCPFVPRYAFETWIIPKAHQSDYVNAGDATLFDLAEILHGVLVRMKKVLHDPSYNFYLHTAPVEYAGKMYYHWHIEIIPKLTRSVGFEWGTGLHIVPTFPQTAARYLREAR